MVIFSLIVVLASPESAMSDDFRTDPSRSVFSDVVTLNEDEINGTIDFGFAPEMGLISGISWNDSDDWDGIKDDNESGLPCVNISIYNTKSNLLINSTVTDESGNFTFVVPYGEYYVTSGDTQELPTLYEGEVFYNFCGKMWMPTNPNSVMVIIDSYSPENTTIEFGFRWLP
jgi:hypothetical protein